MAVQRHLTKAPIEEALIDVQVRLRDDFPLATLQELGTEFGTNFPKSKQLFSFEGKLGFERGQPVNEIVRDKSLDGFAFLSADERTIFQVRRNGFTFNRLKPYSSWAELFPESQRLLSRYLDVSSPLDVTRLAVRYINRIDIPDKQFSLADYLAAPPAVPTGAPSIISEFLTRVVVHDTEIGASANVIQMLEKGVSANAVPIIVDIDAYMQGSFDRSELGGAFASLHSLKNRIFFTHITEKTARLFE